MERPSREIRKLDRIRSVSLEDIVNGRHTRWRRFLRLTRTSLPVISLIALTTTGGFAAYHIWSGPDDGGPLIVSAPPAEIDAPVHTGALPAEDPAPAANEIARLPRARPDDPVIAGSIAPAEIPPPSAAQPANSAPPTVVVTTPPRRNAEPPPCRALREFSAAIGLQIHCVHRPNSYAPPPEARYVPGPPYVTW